MDSSHHFNDIVLYGVNIKCCYLYLKSYIWLVRNFFLSVLCSFGVCVAFFMLNHTHHRYEIYIQDSKLWKTTNTVFCARRATTLSASNQNGGKSLSSILTFRIEFNCGILIQSFISNVGSSKTASYSLEITVLFSAMVVPLHANFC